MNPLPIAHEMLDVLESIENDAGQVPDWLWDRIQSVIAKAKNEPNPSPGLSDAAIASTYEQRDRLMNDDTNPVTLTNEPEKIDEIVEGVTLTNDIETATPIDVVVLVERGRVSQVATLNPGAIVSVIDLDLLAAEGVDTISRAEIATAALDGLTKRFEK